MSDYNVIVTDPFTDLVVTVDEENITVTLSAVGDNGPIGYTGSVGYTGSIGFTGSQGIQGVAGFTGSQGIEGQRGFTGSQGPIGYTGSIGTVGYTGSMGLIGYVGSRGYTGSRGDTGFVGSAGQNGTQGYTGSKGTDGSIGYTGSKGTDGSTGYTGSQGVGYTGSQGPIGYTGSAGSLGSVTTDDITEGITNLYFTEARVDTAIADSVTTAALTVTGMSEPIVWNSTYGTLDVPMLNGVTLQLGQEEYFYAKATEAISTGQAVMFAGAQGDHLLIAKADITAVGFKDEYVIGIAAQEFATNDFGYVTSFGKVTGLNTNSFNEGDLLYISTTPGVLTTTAPTAPTHAVLVAAVTRKHATQGSIFVRPKQGNHVSELHDVLITDAAQNDVLVYNATTNVWENSAILGDIDAALEAILGV